MSSEKSENLDNTSSSKKSEVEIDFYELERIFGKLYKELQAETKKSSRKNLTRFRQEIAFHNIEKETEVPIEKIRTLYEVYRSNQDNENLDLRGRIRNLEFEWKIFTAGILGGITLVATAISFILTLQQFNSQFLKSNELKETENKLEREKSVTTAWQTLKKYSGEKANYGRSEALEQLASENISLDGIDVAGANLNRLNLSSANLEAIANENQSDTYKRKWLNFPGIAGLFKINTQQKPLEEEKFASVERADFRGAQLQSSNLTNVVFLGTDFSPYVRNTEAEKEVQVENTQEIGPSSTDAAESSGRQLTGGQNVSADIAGEQKFAESAISDECKIPDTDTDTQPQGKPANLTKAILVGANLANARLDHAILTEANFSNANLTKTTFKNADVAKVNFRGIEDRTYCLQTFAYQLLGLDDVGQPKKPAAETSNWRRALYPYALRVHLREKNNQCGEAFFAIDKKDIHEQVKNRRNDVENNQRSNVVWIPEDLEANLSDEQTTNLITVDDLNHYFKSGPNDGDDINEYDLKLLQLENTKALPSEGKGLVAVTKIANSYYVRIFNRDGKLVLDKGKGEFLPDKNLAKQIDTALDSVKISGKPIDYQTGISLIIKITSNLEYDHKAKVDLRCYGFKHFINQNLLAYVELLGNTKILTPDKNSEIPKYLVHVNFSGSNLKNMNFSEFDLQNIDFTGTQMTRADFSGTTLQNVDFTGATLTRANFKAAKAENLRLTDTNIYYANLTGIQIPEDEQGSILNYLAPSKNIEQEEDSSNNSGPTREKQNLNNWELALYDPAARSHKELCGKVYFIVQETVEELQEAIAIRQKAIEEFQDTIKLEGKTENRQKAIEELKQEIRELKQEIERRQKRIEKGFAIISHIADEKGKNGFSKKQFRHYLSSPQAKVKGKLDLSCYLFKKNENTDFFVGQNLTNANFQKSKLKLNNLSLANLRGADLRGADLLEANLSQANLQDADLRNANLSRSNLSQANLQGIKLQDAHLTYANLLEITPKDDTLGQLVDEIVKAKDEFNAIYSPALRKHDQLCGQVNFLIHQGGGPETRVEGNSPDIKGNSQNKVSVEEFQTYIKALTKDGPVDLSCFTFKKFAGSQHADYFSDQNLVKANLSQSDLKGVDLSTADLSGANLWKANLEEANLSQVKGLKVEQVANACNFETATFDKTFAQQLTNFVNTQKKAGKQLPYQSNDCQQ